MESNPSNKPVTTDDPCYICEKTSNTTDIRWVPMDGVRIIRRLCQECRIAFKNETDRIQSRKARELHVAYKHWESVQRAHHHFSNRQHVLPNV